MLLESLFGLKRLGPDYNYGGFDWSRYSSQSSSGTLVNANSAMRVSAVLACVRVISETLASLPIVVYKALPDRSKVRLPAAPLSILWKRGPNKWQTTFEWMEMMAAHCALRGNAYSRIIPGDLGAVSELIPLHPGRMRIERASNGRLIYVYINPQTGEMEEYSQDEIHHWRWLSDDGVNGISPIQAMRDTIGVAQAQEGHTAALFRNGATLNVALQTDQPLSPESAKTLRDNFERIHGGFDKAGRTAVLHSGLKAVQLGMNNQDAQTIDMLRFTTEQIARIYRVPLHLIQDLSRSTNNNITHQSLEFVMYTMLPWVRRIESAMNRDLVVNRNQFVEFLLDGLLRGDPATRAEYLQKMFYIGVFTQNDIARLENLNPIGPIGDHRFVQANMTTIERVISGENVSGTQSDTPRNDQTEDNQTQTEDDNENESPQAESTRPASQNAGQLTSDANEIKISKGIRASLAIAESQYNRMLRWEIDACRRASKNPSEFLNKVDAFYEEHEPRLSMALLPSLSLASELSGTPYFATDVAHKHVEFSKSQLLDAAGRAHPNTLSDEVEKCLSLWKTRTMPINESQKGISHAGAS